jgi:peptidoglycan/xylan/chitin deacetylase (PgdA/CDA1 family)
MRAAAASALALCVVSSVAGCGARSADEATFHQAEREHIAPQALTQALPAVRPQLDGSDFPDKVVALTWDDGPDADTLALASFLAAEHVSATFFVVGEWASEVSDDPGLGRHVFETGYSSIPILGDLVALGHRLGNHTLHHVLLSLEQSDVVDRELRQNQESIDPMLTNELRLFRAPGGAWGSAASRALDADPYLTEVVGPFRWDIDRKDWESSLRCPSANPSSECEPLGPGRASRVKPEVVARRYLESIEAKGHGIVLLHDRVGDVGSDYALAIAKHLVPALKAKGFVFTSPILRFVSAAPRLAVSRDDPSLVAPGALELVDLDGDGRADACIRASGGITCARSSEIPGTPEDRRPRTVFATPLVRTSPAKEPASEASALRGDLNGDGRTDTCARGGGRIQCTLSTGRGFIAPSLWLAADQGGDVARLVHAPSLAMGDINGDGRSDLCGYDAAGIVCALAP